MCLCYLIPYQAFFSATCNMSVVMQSRSQPMGMSLSVGYHRASTETGSFSVCSLACMESSSTRLDNSFIHIEHSITPLYCSAMPLMPFVIMYSCSPRQCSFSDTQYDRQSKHRPYSHIATYVNKSESVSHSGVSNTFETPWSPPGSSVHGDPLDKNTGMVCHSYLQGIFPTQGSNPGLPHCGQILYRSSQQRSHSMSRGEA